MAMTWEEFHDRVRALRAAEVPTLDVDREVNVPENSTDSAFDAAVLAHLRERAHEYLSNEWVNENGCPGGHAGGFRFEWSIHHGSCHCWTCHWPARYFHYVEVNGERRLWEALLLYHPNQLVLPEDPDNETEAANG